ncbi:hypothetical protein N9D31_01665 [Oligoflexaceae bacterium]|nr:hypothetical protein [Oligoflexaceae bacterium]
MSYLMNRKTILQTIGLILALTFITDTAFGQSHAFINAGRSSSAKHLFVTQAVEAEFGTYTMTDAEGISDSKTWNGYGFRNAIGTELLKFIQFSANHTFLNMAGKDSSSERLTGSRLAGELKFSFASPLGNLEMGAGAIVSRYDMQRQLQNTSIYGTGIYYTVGVNYFVSSQVSIFGNMKSINETFVRNSGAKLDSDVQTATTSAGFGASIWL